jgi:hypothetical protein
LINAGELEVHPFFFSILIRRIKVTLRRYFQQSAILVVTLTLTFHILLIPESQFYKTWRRKAILRAKATADCLIPELMKIL